MTATQISSEDAAQQSVAAIAGKLRALDALVEDIGAARSDLAALRDEAALRLAECAGQLERLRADAELVHRDAVEYHAQLEALAPDRKRLAQLLAHASDEVEFLRRRAQEITDEARAAVRDGLSALRGELDTRLGQATAALSTEAEERLARDRAQHQAWIDELSERQRKQLDDVLRAYELARTRLQEVDSHMTGRLASLEQRLETGEATARAEAKRLSQRLGLALALSAIAASGAAAAAAVALLR